MAVQLATLDILTDRARFEPEVARAIGDAITMEINHSRDTLATRADVIAFRAEFEAFRTGTRQEFVLVRAEIKVAMAECKSAILRWMFAAMATQTALLVGIMYFMLQHLR